jgi:DNA-binding transcriptional MerR regulator
MQQKYQGFPYLLIILYDKESLLPFVSRNKAGIRVFTASDLLLIQTICYLKNTGMQIKDIREYIHFCMEGASTIDSRKKLLTEHRKEIIAQINALHENLKLIDSKIQIYASPNATEIINEQIWFVDEEKRENCLLSNF